jgi:hypothetical protein
MAEENEDFLDSSDLEDAIDEDFQRRQEEEKPLDIEEPEYDLDLTAEDLQDAITEDYERRRDPGRDRQAPRLVSTQAGGDAPQEIADAIGEIVREVLQEGIDRVKGEMKDHVQIQITETLIPLAEDLMRTAIEDVRDEMMTEILKVDRLGI